MRALPVGTLVLLSLLLLVLPFGSACRRSASAGLLAVGADAPTLEGIDQSGESLSLTPREGTYTVVYFYPKDSTPGCTKQACAFRDSWDRLQAAKIAVIGVSNDDVESHARFADEHQLPFPLVADSDGKWAEAFGVPSTAGYYARVTFLIDSSGDVARVYPDVDPALNAQQILDDVAELRSAG